MRERKEGVSSISPLKSVYYMIKVTLAILVERIRRKEYKNDDCKAADHCRNLPVSGTDGDRVYDQKRSLDLKYALSWLLALVFVLVLDLFPVLLTKLSMALGVWAPVNMIFSWDSVFASDHFTLTVMLSRMAERVRKLAQAVAMNEENWTAWAGN